MVEIWRRGAATLAVVLMVGGCGAAADLVESEPTTEPSPTETSPTEPSPTEPSPTEPSPTPTQPVAAEPKVGECRRTNPFLSALGGSLEVRKPVPCRDTHNAQTYFVGLMNEAMQAAARRGNANGLRAEVAGICGRKLSEWLGGSGEDVALSVFDYIVGAPGPDEVGADARWFSCDAYAIRAMNGLKLIALPPDTRGILNSRQADDWTQCNRGGFGSGTSNIVVCTRGHAYRAVAGVHLDSLDAKYPGSNNLDSRLESECSGRVRAYLNTSGSFNYGFTWPSRQQWNTGDRWGICYAQTSS
jgi:hypothetical protein